VTDAAALQEFGAASLEPDTLRTLVVKPVAAAPEGLAFGWAARCGRSVEILLSAPRHKEGTLPVSDGRVEDGRLYHYRVMPL
jgi:hypothetical protein